MYVSKGDGGSSGGTHPPIDRVSGLDPCETHGSVVIMAGFGMAVRASHFHVCPDTLREVLGRIIPSNRRLNCGGLSNDLLEKPKGI